MGERDQALEAAAKAIEATIAEPFERLARAFGVGKSNRPEGGDLAALKAVTAAECAAIVRSMITPDPPEPDVASELAKLRDAVASDTNSPAWYELRHHDVTLDEVVTGPVENVHLEHLDDGHWWLGLAMGGERLVVDFHSDSTITATAERDE